MGLEQKPGQSIRAPAATVLAGVVALGLCAAAASGASLQTILTNGPTANRINIVVLSEGYTTNEMVKFLTDATNAINVLLAFAPYAEYRQYFNVFAIAVPSNQSGSDHPSWPLFRDTYFNSSYDTYSDRIITIPPNDQDANYSHGQGKVDALLQSYLPACDLPVLLVNDSTPGGSGGSVLIASANGGSWPIFIHESGHSLGGLGDEYTNAYPNFPDIEEPNTTRQTNHALIKWNAWIDPGTPLPTPPTSDYSSVVGLFEGAHYHGTGWYRPKMHCMMREYGNVPFCEVCSEALVLSFYRTVRPVDAFLPASTNLFVTSPQPLTFSLAPLQPATHNLGAQWLTNGTPVAGATNTAFTILSQSLGNGSNTVSAVVLDATGLVRSDPTNLLRQPITWNVNVSFPKLRLDSPRWLAGGRFAFRVTGNAPQGFVIEASTNLTSWIPLVTNSLVGGQFNYTNSGAASFQLQHFRAQALP